ncbi:MAG: hypothetical protein ACLQLG_18580 [Thermoguttaceae bacterium]
MTGLNPGILHPFSISRASWTVATCWTGAAAAAGVSRYGLKLSGSSPFRPASAQISQE